MEDGNEDWVAESVESALKRRRLHVLHLLSLGWNKSQIARATGENRRTVCRWAKKVVTPPTPVKPLNHRPCADSQAKVVTPYEKNTPQERFFCFDSEGNPDIAIYDDPIDHIEQRLTAAHCLSDGVAHWNLSSSAAGISFFASPDTVRSSWAVISR